MLPLRKLFLLTLLSTFALQAQDTPDPLNSVMHEILVKNWQQAARELDKAEKEATLFEPDSSLTAADYNELGAIAFVRGNRDAETLKLAEMAFQQADAIYKATIKAGPGL